MCGSLLTIKKKTNFNKVEKDTWGKKELKSGKNFTWQKFGGNDGTRTNIGRATLARIWSNEIVGI